MKLVLTGAGGFLGLELLSQLASREDAEVLAVSSKDDLFGACGFPEQRLTVVNPAALLAEPDMMVGFDMLLNCAFPRNVDGEALARGLDFISALFLAAATRVNAVVNVSSQSVYSQRRMEPATEETPVCLESAYAVAKYATELMLEEACAGIPRTNIRLASLIGPGFDQRVVNKFVAQALAGETIAVQEKGMRYGYFDVADAAEALILLVTSDSGKWQRVYNVGVEDGFTLSELAIAVVEAVRNRGINAPSPQIERLDNLAVTTAVDAGLFSLEFSWHNGHDIAGAIERIIEANGEI